MKTNQPNDGKNWRDALEGSWREDAPTGAELSAMWSKVEARAASLEAEGRVAKARAVPSPWLVLHARAVASFAVLALLVSGGGMSAAAERALPGDFLYPVKVSVNEAAIEAFAVSPEGHARAKVQIVERRADEIEALSEENRLTAEVAADIVESIEAHAEEIVAEVAVAPADAEGRAAQARAAEIVSTEFAAAIDESASALETALIAAGGAPAPEAAMFSVAMSAKIAPEDDAAADADMAENARVAEVADEAAPQAAEEGDGLSPEDAAQIDEARAALDALATTLDALDGVAEIDVALPPDAQFEYPFPDAPIEEPPTTTPEMI